MSAELPTATVDILKEAYIAVTYPNPFNKGDTSKAEVVYGRIDSIGFSPYWRHLFQEFRGYNGTPAGMFSQNSFRAAEEQEGPQLLTTVARELAESFGEYILNADLTVPLPEGVAITGVNLSPLAQFLIERRTELEGSVAKLYAAPRDISDSWIMFVHALASTDPGKNDELMAEMDREYRATDAETRMSMEEFSGFLGGYGTFDRNHQLSCTIAKVLAASFPEVVISQLKAASTYSLNNKPY